MKSTFFPLAMLITFFTFGQASREALFPNVGDYETVVVDLHMHTVFSDGSVWPDIRVQEAIKDNVDLISMTEHLEYQPHSKDIPHPDRNRAYEVAMAVAKDQELMVVNGSEITRDMPPGHNNAVFIQDANKLLVDDPVEAFRAANAQGAFVFWNHPNWTSQYKDGIARLTDMHRQLIDEKLLHGIEVVNDVTISEEALQIALDNDLTIIGTSDIHGLVDWQYKIPEGGHRPVTMVFAEVRNPESVKEALMARRTAVWYNDVLVGREAHLAPLIEACLQVTSASYPENNDVLNVTIENRSSAHFLLQRLSGETFHANTDIVDLPAREETTLAVKTGQRVEELTLRFSVLSAIHAPGEHPTLELVVKVE